MRFIHIGIHKTGSTLLQRSLFSSLEDAVVGTPSAPECLHDLTRLIWSRDYGDLSLERWSVDFTTTADACGQKPALLSLTDENLSGHMWTGAGTVLVAERLAALWPDARILIVLRDPIDYVMSAFDEHCRLGGASSLQRLLVDRAIPGSAILRRIDYNRIVRAYTDRFPKESVLVLPYELLVESPLDFFDRVVVHCRISPAFDCHPGTIWNPSSPSWIRTFVRLQNFAGLPREIEWDRFRSAVPWWDKLDGKVRARSKERLAKRLRVLQAVDGLLSRSSTHSYGFTWGADLERFQQRYSSQNIDLCTLD